MPNTQKRRSNQSHRLQSIENYESYLELVGSKAEASSERRSEPRYSLAIPVKIQALDKEFNPSGPLVNSLLKDISNKGVGLLHECELSSRHFMLVMEQTNISKSAPLELFAEVVRCRKILSKIYDIGAIFIRPPVDDVET